MFPKMEESLFFIKRNFLYDTWGLGVCGFYTNGHTGRVASNRKRKGKCLYCYINGYNNIMTRSHPLRSF
jgi:hypothetical protein